MKKLLAGELRFTVKKINKAFRVYDRANGSFPYRTVELGEVVQDVPETEAVTEAERLNEKFVSGARVSVNTENTKTSGRAPRAKKRSAEKIAQDVAPVAATTEPELPDYGDLSDQSEKYVEGIFESVKY